ncbi:uncharacterized protein LOC112084026 [Eutrema salsugineum]|uniref:uncharacterized protein LOC112084026 n=1 Tax=Eutrema salsugineum TaxID=72664 RepID=UPI000CECECC2|nr:uncharacterized protein LOC112084026 [Eutrema salsugineum]
MDGSREELHRLRPRFLLAVLLEIFSAIYGREAGFDISSDPNPKAGGVAFGWAKEFRLLAFLSFVMVSFTIARVPLEAERLRRAQEECDVYLGLGSLCLLISLSFSAYVHWFV